MVYEDDGMVATKWWQNHWKITVLCVGMCTPSGSFGDEPVLLTNRSANTAMTSAIADGKTRYYETAIVQTDPIKDAEFFALQTAVESFVAEGGVVKDRVSGEALAVSALDWAQVYGIYVALELRTKNVEADLRLRSDRGDPRIVSVSIEPNGVVQVSRSRTWSPEYPWVPRPQVRSKYDLNGIHNGDADWTKSEVGVLADALSYLTPQEQQYLKGVTFLRDHRHRKELAASYSVESRHTRVQQRIVVYDMAFAGLEQGFVGPVAQPKSMAHMVILHELAHLIASQPRISRLSVLNRLIRQHNRLVSTYNQRADPDLVSQIDALAAQIEAAEAGVDRRGDGPIVEAYAAHRSSRKGPTRYANQSTEEAFAESYALFKLDPLALKRTDLGAYEWFLSGAYLAMLPED